MALCNQPPLPIISELAKTSLPQPVLISLHYIAVPMKKWEVNLDSFLPLYCAAYRGNWEEAKEFLDKNLNAKEARITHLSMTALHVAASEGHSEFVERLVDIVPAAVLEIQDDMGFTPLHYAAMDGNMRSAKALLKKNPKLAQCVDMKGRTPLLLAATFAFESKDLVWYFLLVTTNEEPGHPFTGPWAVNLVNVLIASGLHDIALYVLEKYPKLATETDQENCTPLYVLARNQESFRSGSTFGFWENFMYAFLPIEVNYRPPHSVIASVARHESTQNLPTMTTSEQYGVLHGLRRILYGVIKAIAPTNLTRLQDVKLRHHCAVELVKRICVQLSKQPVSWRLNYFLTSEILYIAAYNGIVEIIRALVEDFPDVIWVPHSSNNQYLLLTLAIELRHESLFRMLCDKTARSKLMASTLLESGTTILHLAANLAPAQQRSAISGAALQMQRELQWFKVVEKLIHPYYKDARHAEKQTARELFTTAHKELAESGEKWLKDTSNSCMLVATLIATVVFAAAFQLPGGNDSDGSPNALKKNSAVFMVFAVSDTIALFSSLTSLLMFLSILTARYAEEDFLESLPKRLIIGLASLFFAIASTMVAFGATLGIVLGKKYHWISIPITLLATFPVTLFALLQLPLFIQMVRSTFGKSVFSPQNLR